MLAILRFSAGGLFTSSCIIYLSKSALTRCAQLSPTPRARPRLKLSTRSSFTYSRFSFVDPDALTSRGCIAEQR
jgi:hypothetical protein